MIWILNSSRKEHCIKSQQIMAEKGVDPAIIHATASHGYGLTVDIKPEHEMEKVLYAVDELTGLIGAAALMRPSKSCRDMELKSLKKKYKSTSFAAGCSREVIARGADMLGWELDRLLADTLEAMKEVEEKIGQESLTVKKESIPFSFCGMICDRRGYCNEKGKRIY